MCSCVPGEVLRQCSAANPVDICVPSLPYARCHDCTELNEGKSYFIFHACIADTAVCTPMHM